MAIVTITIVEGRSRGTKRQLAARLTDAVVESLNAEPRQVRVVINEVPEGNYAVAGVPVHARQHLPDEPE